MPFMGQSRTKLNTEAEGPKAWTVTEASELVRRSLESEFGDITVEGSLSGAKIWGTSGHLYFKLEDEGAVLDAAMWRNDVRLLTFEPQNGMRVRARGKITYFAKGGRLQMSCRSLEVAGGVGEREKRLRELRARLEAEGALDPSRKRPIPTLPRKIALVTSQDGAVIRDLLTIILRRFPRAHLIVVPVRVQGEGASESVAEGIRRAILTQVDVMIVGRGGGSKEDLWAFNEEPVARAIFASPIPVITAIGHETDHTLADDVSDRRAATPSEAGELVVPELTGLESDLARGQLRLHSALQGLIRDVRVTVESLGSRPALSDPLQRVVEVRQELDDSERRLIVALESGASRRHQGIAALGRVLDAHRPNLVLRDAQSRIRTMSDRLVAAVTRPLTLQQAKVGALGASLTALNPVAVLGRGFSLTWVDRGGKRELVRSAADVPNGVEVTTSFASGTDLVSVSKGESKRSIPESDSPTK